MCWCDRQPRDDSSDFCEVEFVTSQPHDLESGDATGIRHPTRSWSREPNQNRATKPPTKIVDKSMPKSNYR
jgi:hypothetical protein